MKRLLLTLAISLFVSSAVMAHGYGSRGFDRGDTETWRQMDVFHEAMHGISVDTDKIQDGISIKIKAESDEIANTLVNELNLNQEKLSEYFEGTEVTVEGSGKELAIAITSDDVNVVEKLQDWRRGLVYEYLRDQMADRFGGGRGFWGHMGGRGMMGGWHGGYHMMDGDYGDWNSGYRHMNWDDSRGYGAYGDHMM